MGIELPWYNHRMTDENQGDLPWLDPFSGAEAQPRIVPNISSTSHNDLNQLEAGIGTRTQPPDSPVMPNDAVLRDAPPVYSEGRDLTGRQGDIDSTMAAQKSDAAQLVAAVLTRAVLVVSRLTAPELAGQGVLTVVISSNCDKSPPGEASIVVNESTKPYNSEEDNTVQSAENERLSVASGDEPNDCDNHSTGGEEMENGRDLGENSTSPERASLVVEESLYSPKSEEEGSSDIICQLAQNLASALQCTKSSDCDDQNEELSVASGDEPNDCDNHSTGRAEMENGRDLGENSTSPERASRVVEESLYSPKSEEEGSSDIICELAQNLASALQCTKSSDCDDQSKEGIGAEEGKQLPGDAVPEQLSASIESSVRSDTDLVELALPLKEAVNDPDLNENRLSHEEASLEMEESFYSSKSSNDEEQSPSVIQVNSSVQSTDCKQPSVASADQSASGHNNDESGTGSSIQSIDKHFSLYQVVSSAGCVSSDYCDSSSKFQTGNISPEDGSSKQTNEEESSQSTNHKNLSPQPVTVASTASLMSDESGRLDGPLHTTCDVDHDIIAASLDFKQMVYDSRSSSCRLRHIYTDYNQAEYKPLIKDCSLEVNVSSHSLKTSKSDSSCIAGRSKLRDNSISRRANTPSICSEPRLNTTDNPSSSDFCLYIARSSAYERLRAESTAHNKSNIDHANYGRDVVDRPLSIGHDGHFTGDIDILQSPHKLSADQGSSLSLKSTNGTAAACSNEHVCVIMDDADYFTALSSQCSSEQAAGSEDIHTTPSRPMMPPAPDIGFIMNPRAHSSPNPSGCDDYQSAAKNMDHTSHYNDRNTSVDKSLPGDVYFESCVDKMSPLPRNASPELNCDSDDGNFQDSSSTIGSGHQSLHQVASSNYPFFSVKAASYGISADYSPSDSRSYPLDSNDETRVIMDLDEVELPHSRYYDDQELLDADINTRLPITACSSTDYYSAASGTSGHDSGNHPSPVNSVLSTEDEVRIIMELEGSPNGDSSMLKMSSSTSLFIPRGLSNAQWKSSSSLASHSDQRNDSTTTFHSILLQLSGSSAGEEDKEQRSNDPQLPQLVYEPY